RSPASFVRTWWKSSRSATRPRTGPSRTTLPNGVAAGRVRRDGGRSPPGARAVVVGLPVREGGRSGQAVVTPGRAVAARSAIGLVEIIDLHDIPQLDALDEELCDPVTARDPDGFGRIEVDEVHLDLPPVARVDGPGSVDDGQARPRRQSGPRVHETHVPDGQR